MLTIHVLLEARGCGGGHRQECRNPISTRRPGGQTAQHAIDHLRRGLARRVDGDVGPRIQGIPSRDETAQGGAGLGMGVDRPPVALADYSGPVAVSYTHLTLPTS